MPLFWIALEAACCLQPASRLCKEHLHRFLSSPQKSQTFEFYVCLSLINFNKSFYTIFLDGFFESNRPLVFLRCIPDNLLADEIDFLVGNVTRY